LPGASPQGTFATLCIEPDASFRNNLQKDDLTCRTVLKVKEVVMENPTKEQVIHRAYELWEQAGKPEGKDEDFYHQAEQELRDADKSSPLRTPDNL
jgi:hypothetical protein